MAGQIVPRRPVTTLDRIDTLNSVIKDVTPIFNDLGDRLVDYPGFIESNEPRSPLGSATRSVARLNCRLWAASDKSNYRSRVNARNSELCGPYLDSIGENPDPGSIDRPFLGGQCPVRYFVNVEWQSRNTDGSLGALQSQQVTGSLGRPGPIVGVERRGGSGSWQMVLSHGTDSIFTSPESVVRSSTSANESFVNLKIVSVSRVDGAVDSCGDPDPLIRPPATVVPTSPLSPIVNVNLPGVGPVDVSIELNGDGDPIICIPILGQCQVVKVGDDGSGGGGVPPLDPEVGDPIPQPGGGGGGGDGGGEDTPFGPPPDGRIWVGAFVQVLGDMTPWGVVPGSAPENSALTRVVGNASLIIDNGLIARVRTKATQIRSEWSEHLVTYPGLTVNGIRVNINPALSYRTFPISVADPQALETQESG